MAGEVEDHAGRLRAAARWYAELKEPDLSAESFEAFQAWEANPANAAAFREIERTLVVVDRTGFGRAGGAPGLAGRWRAGAVWLSGVAAHHAASAATSASAPSVWTLPCTSAR